MTFNLLSQGWLTLIVALIIAISFVVAFRKSRNRVPESFAGLRKKPFLLDPSYRALYDTLCDALDYEFHVFSKVCISELIARGPTVSERRFNRLSDSLNGQTFDYVVCKKSDLSIAAVIELESREKTTSASQAVQRSALIKQLCAAMKLKVFYLDADQRYRGQDLRRLITGQSQCAKPNSKESSTLEVATSWTDNLVTETEYDETALGGLSSCPDCHSELVTKMAMKGPHIGERFVMCRKYPYCEYRVQLDEHKALQKQTDASTKRNTGGFVHPHDRQPQTKGYSNWAG